MTIQTFKKTIEGLSTIPAEAKKQCLLLAKDLSVGDLEAIATHMKFLNGELQKHDTKYASALAREKEMITQIKKHDLPALNALYNA